MIIFVVLIILLLSVLHSMHLKSQRYIDIEKTKSDKDYPFSNNNRVFNVIVFVIFLVQAQAAKNRTKGPKRIRSPGIFNHKQAPQLWCFTFF